MMGRSKQMQDSFYFSQLNCFFERWFEPYQAAALMTADHLPIYIKYQNLPDIGTLPVVTETVGKYLKVSSGDIVLTNDPYCGGSTLTAMTLMMGVHLEPRKSGGTAEFLFCVRFNLKPRLQMTDTVEDEGVRIPPTPIRHNGQLNEGLLRVISDHPQCPRDFLNGVHRMIEAMDNSVRQMKQDTSSAHLDWSKPRLRQYFKESSRLFSVLLGRIAFGETSQEMTLDSGEKLRLNLDVTEGKIKFDFSGSGPSAHLHLTDGATLGACVGAILSVIESNIPLNAGIFDRFEVRAPQGTLVNAKYPAPVYQGMTDGAGLLANFILQVLSGIDPSIRLARSGPSLCSFELEFGNGLFFFDTLEPGMAASSSGRGHDSINPWQKSHLEPSIEEIERRYPLLVKSCTIRQKSGGSGNFEGGNGATKAVLIKSSATLRWMITQASQKPEGGEGGKSASSAELYLQKANSKERERMPARGEFTMKAGDIVIMHSSGGGGFGE